MGQTINAGALLDGESLSLKGSADNVTVSLIAGDVDASAYTVGDIIVNATTGSNDIKTGAGNDTITAGTGADTIIAAAGADTIILGAAGDVDIVRYTADADAGTAGTLTTAQGDTITGFTSGVDKIAFTGNFLTGSLTGTASDAVTALASAAGHDQNATTTSVKLITMAGGTTATDLVTIGSLVTAVGAIANEATGDENIYAFISADGNTALYKYTGVTVDSAVAANELQLLGIVGTALVAGDFQFA